ncbi:MAG TPA: ATP-binding protein, partial [Dissulfurispiraceae bacterium]|nr:ATP-binding protein [Dissulfurispiraceae bacterium]
ETSYLEGIKLTANDEPEGMGPSGRAIVESRHIVSVDFEKEARMLPWRDRARAHGIRSSSVFPLFSAGRVIGELTIYSDEPSYFTEEEISLLLSIANNISYALDAISIEQKRLKAEEALRQLNEELEQRVSVRTLALEEANRELEAFSYSASHDLRAPLRHLSGFVDLLRNELQDQASIKAQNYMKSIAKASKKMGMLIDDLLAFSRIGRSEMKMRMINLNVIIKNVIGELQTETTGRDITWELEVLPDVYGDQSLFRMLFVNLISNAIKFTRTVAHAEISVGSEDRGKEFIFYVKDNGVGFDMKYMSKLFGVFERLHTESEFEGTGIGLANVQRIIARHGGRTWAEGAVGRGATIYFSLPKLEKV